PSAGAVTAALCRGMNEATAKASSAALPPTARTVLKPFSEGRETGPKRVVIWDRMTPATALAVDVPMDRIRVLRLLAAPDWDGGTAPMISAGIAPYVKPIPEPMTQDTSTNCQTSDISRICRP